MDTVPTALDLALCLVILQSQPEHLSAREYISLLRSSVIPFNLSESNRNHDCLQLDGSEFSNKLVDATRRKTAELQAKVLELERKNSSLQSQLDKIKGKAKPELQAKDSRLSGKRKQSCEATVETEDTGLWTKFIPFSPSIPHLVNNLKCLLLAESSQALSAAIQETCSALVRIVRPYCKERHAGAIDTPPPPPCKKPRPNREPLSPPPPKPTKDEGLAKAVCNALSVTLRKLVSSLDQLRVKEDSKLDESLQAGESVQRKKVKLLSPLLAGAAYSLISLATELMHFVYLNSASLIKWKLALSQNKTSNLPVLDLRMVFTDIIIGLLNCLRPQFAHERMILGALLFTNLHLLGCSLAAEEYSQSSEEDGRRQSSGDTLGLNQWFFEESSWYWTKILRKALEVYKLHLKQSVSEQESNERGDFLMASRARHRLLEALFQRSFGCERLQDTNSGSRRRFEQRIKSGSARLYDTMFMNELWELLGIEAFMH